MSLFRWKPEYAVGIKVIDDQHQNLVSLINKLHDAIESYFEDVSLESILQELFDYTRYHFTTEETMMEQYGYSEEKLIKHKKQHQLFIAELNTSQSDIENLTREDAALIQEFLVNWLKNHILKVDTQLAEYLLNQEGVHDHQEAPSEIEFTYIHTEATTLTLNKKEEAELIAKTLASQLQELNAEETTDNKLDQLRLLADELADLIETL